MSLRIGSPEFLECAKRLGFNSGFEYTCWLRKNGYIKSYRIADDEWYKKKGFENKKDYENKLALKKGFGDKKERNRSWHYDKGSLPMSMNVDCSEYLGVHLAERKIARNILSEIFENVEEMPYGNQGFDFLCDGNKIDVKSVSIDSLYKLNFHIRWNRIASHFLLIGFDDRMNEKILGIWLINADEKMMVSRNKNPGSWPKLCDREGFTITHKEPYILQYKKYEVTDKFIKNL